MQNSNHGFGRRAFTLIELLVVVAILALLISMLLPSLTRAKEAARRSLCLVNVRSAAIGFLNYSTEFDGFLPGPNTTGYMYAKGDTIVPDSKTCPLQRDDWMSPVMGRERSLSLEFSERLVEMFNNKFRCPSNTEFYTAPPFAGTLHKYPPMLQIRYNSYSAPVTLHAWSDIKAARAAGQNFGLCLASDKYTANSKGEATVINLATSGHRMRLDTIGSTSLKAAVTEGARFVKTSGVVDFQDDQASTSYGSNFMNRGPGWNCYYDIGGSDGWGEPYHFLTEDSTSTRLNPYGEKYAYRHNGQINISFLDGHAATFDNVGSRKADFWFPSGSTVLKTVDTGGCAMFGDQSLKAGDIIP
jgi:prepilin-type N-terminal cleavage/methylation domain-containing protein/prepilin-type processing-associated H-X9-DG protein